MFLNILYSSVLEGCMLEENVVFVMNGDVNVVLVYVKVYWEIVGFDWLFDFVCGVKVMGVGFLFYVGDGVKIVWVLLYFFLDEVGKNGYLEVNLLIFVNVVSVIVIG